MNKYLRLALFKRRDPVPVIEHGERLWARGVLKSAEVLGLDVVH